MASHMADSYLLLTPGLVLGVLALGKLVGCDLVLGIREWEAPELAPPTKLVATAGNQKIDLSWTPSPDASDGYEVSRGEASQMYTTTFTAPPGSTGYTDSPIVNGIHYYYAVASRQGGAVGQKSNEVDATAGQGLVVSKTLGTLRNDFTGAVGMLIQVGAGSWTIVGLGRIFLPGNTGTHVVKVVNATTGVDVPNASAKVDLSAPTAIVNEFAYGIVAAPVVLSANTEYYVVSQETMGGDQWCDLNSSVQTTSAASVTSAVYGDGVTPYVRGGGPGNTYGPVDVLY